MPRRISRDTDPRAASRGPQDTNRIPVSIVVVTMDGHLGQVLDRVGQRLAADYHGISIELHTADRFTADDTARQACLDAIEGADIVIATMLFLDEHIRVVLPALQARRDSCDAMLCCLSAGEVVRLTRLGRLDMSREGNKALKFLKSLRDKRRRGEAGASTAEAQMRMLRRLPRILRFIPGSAQDLRVYFLALQYWLAGSSENVDALLRLLIGRYAAGPRAMMRSNEAVAAPVEYPETGLYHPDIPHGITTDAAALPAPAAPQGTVGLLLMRGAVLAGDTAHYDAVIHEFEARGYAVRPAFAGGLDFRPAIDAYFRDGDTVLIDAMVSLTGFSLVGGPAYNDQKSAEAVLRALDVPYAVANALEFQSLEAWQADPRGLSPVEATMMVALPELDGATLPMTYAGRRAGDHGRAMAPEPERIARLASRIDALIHLRRTERTSRRIAIVIFNFPPNAGATGTAAYLAVFESLFNTLTGLHEAGYTVEVPDSVEALREAVCTGNAARFGARANVAARIPRDDHLRREPHLADIEQVWGAAPGRHDTDGASLFVHGLDLGNVFVGVQPAFGWEGDPMRLLFEKGFAPTHVFSAFYRWLREDFAADAVLHFGTHGALEFMPGKHSGLSAQCWPDRLIGDLPNICLYAGNNPSEGMLAKRRACATLISHLTPSVTTAGLYRGLADLKASITRWRNLPPGAAMTARQSLAGVIQAEAAALDLGAAEPCWPDDEIDAEIAKLSTALLDLEYALIPHGLHVVGAPPDATARGELLDAAGVTDPDERARLDTLLGADHEIPALIAALDGRYIAPAPGGDVLRNTSVLPTGRNLYGFDPFRMPSSFALDDGKAQAERLLARHVEDQGHLPETVALVLWGSDNLKSEGGPIGQALALIGARPRRDSYGRLAGAELIPLEDLGRPRIDVVVTISGIFRDLLPLQTRLLAEAAQLAATADEPEDRNFIRRHARAAQAETGGTIEDAALRIFSNADGAYGANVNQIVDASAWQEEDELGETYCRRKGFAYGTDGTCRRHDALLGRLLKGVDVAYQNLESLELGVTTVDHYFDGLGGLARAAGTARGTPPPVYIGDQTRGDGTVRSLTEQVAIETRTRTLNPKFFEALLAHGHEGVRHLEAAVTNTLGWSATTGAVDPWIYKRITETFVLDAEMRERLAALNPTASARIAGRLIEAHERHYWAPDPDMLEALRDAGDAESHRARDAQRRGGAAAQA